MTRPVVVLYEDRQGAAQQFGLHELVVRMVAEARGESFESLRPCLRAHPTRGNANLLRKARAIDLVAPAGEPVVAVLDHDQVRRLLGVPAKTCKRDVIAKIKGGCQDADRLAVVLLEQNLESVLEALRPHADSLDIPSSRFDRAMDKGRNARNDRDIIFEAAAEERQRPVRDALLSSLPSLKRLRDRLCAVAVDP